MNLRQVKGFTLIELLVVISIIALLSSIVLSAIGSTREKARTAKTRQEMAQFVKAVIIAQGEGSKTLYAMTGSGCSDCVCRTGVSLKDESGACYSAWVAITNTVQNNSGGIVTGLTNMTRDGWGSPYCLDENQGEGGNCSNRDSFRSVGPDGIYGTGDDISVDLPLSAKCP